jgi:hypothetical protein
MPERRRDQGKEIRKDQQVRREVLSDIGTETVQNRTKVEYRNPNRDQARGDWDRSGRRTDEGSSRDPVPGMEETEAEEQPPEE